MRCAPLDQGSASSSGRRRRSRTGTPVAARASPRARPTFTTSGTRPASSATNFHYLWDKAGQLRDAVGRLVRGLDETSGRPRVRGNVVAAAVRLHGRHYRAGRLLHPGPVELTSAEVGSILLAVAGVEGITAGVTVAGLMGHASLVERIAGDAHGIAERTDVRPDQVVRVLCALRSWELRDAG